MILLLGTRTSVALRATVWFVCHFCGFHAAQQVVERRRRLTLFWLPLFTVSRSYVERLHELRPRGGPQADQVENAERWAASQAIR